jgi:alpha-2-macroglobulin
MNHKIGPRRSAAGVIAAAGMFVATSLFMTQAAWAVFDSAAVPAGSDLKVLRAVPEGDEVPSPGRQLVVTFDRPVVAIGQMAVTAAASPVTVSPSVNCQWHWLDPRSLACELNAAEALAPATRYTVTVAAGIKAQDGAKLKEQYRWTFTTERPAVKGYSFTTWRSPGTPVVRLVFNQPVTKDTVESALRFGGQTSVTTTPDPYEREVFYVLPLPGEPAALLIPWGTPAVKSDDRATTQPNAAGQSQPAGQYNAAGQPNAGQPHAAGQRIEARRVWLVSPPRELPLDTTTELKVLPGLRSYAGPLLGIERRTVVAFDTFPEFRFLGLRCLTEAGITSTLIPVTALKGAQPACNPLGNVSLAFSAPVIAPEIKAHLVLTPDLLNGRTDYDPWANVYAKTRLQSPHQRGTEYTVELPEHLRAFQPYSVVSLKGLRDEFGRWLRGPATMDFRTDHRPPRLRVTHPVAVLEKNAPTSMPLYVTNLTDIDIHYRKLTGTGYAADLDLNQPIDRAWDIAYAAPAKIRGLLDGQSGIVTGILQPHPTPLSVEGYRYFDEADDDPGIPTGRPDRDFLAEVTPYQVHAKLGAYNTLVWVTSLDKGLPAANARVRLYRDNYRGLTDGKPVLAEAVTDRDGIAILAGRSFLEHAAAPELSPADAFMVRVDVGKDMALLPLDGSFLVDTYRASRGAFWSGYGNERDHIHAWGTTAQGVYKLGDTVQYKLYLRNQNNLSLEPVARRSGYQLDIVDPTGKIVQTESNVTLSEFGAYAGSFRVPLSGAVGWYDFIFKRPVAPTPTVAGPTNPAPAPSADADSDGDPANASTRPRSWTPMRVLIADFTPAPFQVTNTLNGQLYQPGDSVEVTTQASLHAGGPYAGAGSRVTARLFPQGLEITNPAAAGFQFASLEPSGSCHWQHGGPDVLTVHQSDATTSEKGEFATQFTLPDANMLSARLEVESAVRDERGKYVANRSFAEFRGRDRFVGLRSERWTFEEGKPATIQYLVVDQAGKVIQGAPVTVSIKVEVVNAARVKGAGDAYLTSYEAQWLDAGSCTAASEKDPQACTFTPGQPGLYSITAEVTDTQGRPHTTELCVWVTGKGRVLWEEPADMSLSVIPEKESYKVGDRARYLIKNPFPGAQALITVERFGVIKHWVQTLAGNTPVIEFTVEPDFVPGFYLSVVVMSPRVAPVPGASPLDKEGVDLGRPTYRIGYLKVPVNDPYKTLDVRIKSDRASYKPRDKVKLTLRATPHAAPSSKEPVEFAVVVLDEAVFDLIQDGKKYFDPYRGMYQLDNLDLVNYSLLTRLIGLQKFEKKGANSGGDGGAGFDMRNVSKYVAYWNPSVIADKNGRGAVSFDLPDNLTGWRVFAIATTAGDRLGLGDYKFKSSKLTELRPVLPNQLTSGDRFTAGFSVLNRSDKTRTIDVALNAVGPIEGASAQVHQAVTLGPFKRDTVWLPVATVSDGSIKLTAFASDKLDKDALAQALPVHKRVSLDVAASYGTTLTSGIDETLQFPADMMPNVGEVSVTLAPSVLGNLDGAMRYVRDYPYLCWEQRLTKALMAANYIKLRGYLAADLNWPEAKSLPQTFLDDASSFQAPNGGMAFWTPDDARVSPYLSAATALAFNHLRAAGYSVPTDVEKHLDGYLEALLRSNTAPTFYSEGMVSSVRAVALQALAERNRVSLVDLQRYEKYAPQMDLFGLAAYLDAAVHVKGADGLARSLAGQILSHANQSGGKFQFTETWDDGYYQLLGTPMRSNCAILSALLRYGETPQGAPLVGDVPFKLVRAITQTRGARDHWENTQENVFCTSALADYAALYEKDAQGKDTPALRANVALDGAAIGSAQFTQLRDPPALVRRDNGAADAGRKATLHIDRAGTGRLYYATRLSYSLKDQTAGETNAGIEVHREYSVQRDGRWQLLASPLTVKRGELVRVDMYLTLAAARHFVVVDDPVPGGLEPVNRDLATASTVDADATEFQAAGGSLWFKYSDWSEYGIALWSFYHRELKHEAAHFYADYLPAGHYHLSYGAQAMAEGQFSASPTKAEEMYDPDVYGKGFPAQVVVSHE